VAAKGTITIVRTTALVAKRGRIARMDPPTE
jgi:hypothetical protein